MRRLVAFPQTAIGVPATWQITSFAVVVSLAVGLMFSYLEETSALFVVGLIGVLQPFADGLKLLIKETIIPSKANKIIFIIAPILTLFLSFLSYAVLPFSLFNVFADINVGVLYIFAISSLGVYGIIMSG